MDGALGFGLQLPSSVAWVGPPRAMLPAPSIPSQALLVRRRLLFLIGLAQLTWRDGDDAFHQALLLRRTRNSKFARTANSPLPRPGQGHRLLRSLIADAAAMLKLLPTASRRCARPGKAPHGRECPASPGSRRTRAVRWQDRRSCARTPRTRVPAIAPSYTTGRTHSA